MLIKYLYIYQCGTFMENLIADFVQFLRASAKTFLNVPRF